MRRQITLSILFVNLLFLGLSQDHISWDFGFDASSQKVQLKASLDHGWHLYSQNLMENAGPVATSFVFEKNNALKLKSKVQEPPTIEKFDMNFESTVNYFENEVVFTQQVKLKKETVLKGTVTYMICNEVMCLPPVDQQFEIKLTK